MTEMSRRPERAKIFGWQAKNIARDYVKKSYPDPKTRLEVRSIKKGFDKTINIEGWSIYGEVITESKAETIILEDLDGRKQKRHVKMEPDQKEGFYLFVIDSKRVHNDISSIVTY